MSMVELQEEFPLHIEQLQQRLYANWARRGRRTVRAPHAQQEIRVRSLADVIATRFGQSFGPAVNAEAVAAPAAAHSGGRAGAHAGACEPTHGGKAAITSLPNSATMSRLRATKSMGDFSHMLSAVREASDRMEAPVEKKPSPH